MMAGLRFSICTFIYLNLTVHNLAPNVNGEAAACINCNGLTNCKASPGSLVLADNDDKADAKSDVRLGPQNKIVGSLTGSIAAATSRPEHISAHWSACRVLCSCAGTVTVLRETAIVVATCVTSFYFMV